MDPNRRREIALWRLNILGPLVSARLEHGDKHALLEAAASRAEEQDVDDDGRAGEDLAAAREVAREAEGGGEVVPREDAAAQLAVALAGEEPGRDDGDPEPARHEHVERAPHEVRVGGAFDGRGIGTAGTTSAWPSTRALRVRAPTWSRSQLSAEATTLRAPGKPGGPGEQSPGGDGG